MFEYLKTTIIELLKKTIFKEKYLSLQELSYQSMMTDLVALRKKGYYFTFEEILESYERTQWRKTSEELPEIGVSVLCCRYDDIPPYSYDIAELYKDSKKCGWVRHFMWWDKPRKDEYYMDTDKYTFELTEFPHWMYLPKFRKGGE